MILATSKTSPSSFEPKPHRWSVPEYHRLAEKGILTEDDRLELIDGAIIDMAPIGSGHAGHVKQLNRLFSVRSDDSVIVAVQDPVVLGDDSEPQPDIMLLRWRDDYYKNANPTAEDVLLIIEVADTSADYDRSIKVPLYAGHAIPEVWLIDLAQQCIEVYRNPSAGEYEDIKPYRDGRITPGAIPDAFVDLAELFGNNS